MENFVSLTSLLFNIYAINSGQRGRLTVWQEQFYIPWIMKYYADVKILSRVE